MALSRVARKFADEIRNHDWSDAPFRVDRAGHRRESDVVKSSRTSQLELQQTDFVRMNVMWVVGQVLWSEDPNFQPYEFADACGVDIYAKSGRLNGGIEMGFRRDAEGRACSPAEGPGQPSSA
ncbi:hypothetical protein ACFWU5_27090 [Nocardia sp. NPDC058640]|uniref:hypothetical protein n=1 Tax=Nocardia sp. NPDC058640 TaxID=3346571 RepID=UPI003654A486